MRAKENIRSRNYKRNNPQKVLDYRLKNREKERARNKRYKQSRKGRLTNRRYIQSESRRQVVCRYNSSFKGKICRRAIVHRRKARKRLLGDNMSAKEIQFIWELYENKCFRCGGQDTLQLDHFYPLSKGYGLDYNGFNISILCKKCNALKRDIMPEEVFSKNKMDMFNQIKNKFLIWKSH